MKNKKNEFITFAEQAQKLDKKYKDRDSDTVLKDTYEMEMKNLKAKNDIVKIQYENTEKMKRVIQEGNNSIIAKGVMAKGGTLPKYYLGNSLTVDPLHINFEDPLRINNGGFAPEIPGYNSMIQPKSPIDPLNPIEILKPKEISSNNPTPTISPAKSYGSFKEALNTENKDFNYNNLAMGLKSGQLLNSFKNAITPALQEKPILPDYSTSDARTNSMSYDDTQAINQVVRNNNTQVGQINDNTISDATRQARLAGNNSNVNSQIGQIKLNTQQLKNNILAQQGQYESGKAGTIASSLYQNRVDNLQNQANKDLAKEQFVQNLSQIGGEANKYQYFKDALKNNKDIALLKGNEGFKYIESLSNTFGLDGSKEYEAYVNNPSEENIKKLNEALKLKIKSNGNK